MKNTEFRNNQDILEDAQKQMEYNADQYEDKDAAAAYVLGDFNTLVARSARLDEGEAEQFQEKAMQWVMDTVLDDAEMSEMKEIISYLSEQLDAIKKGEVSLESRIKKAGKIDKNLMDEIRLNIWGNDNGGKIDFGAEKTYLERRIGLSDIFKENKKILKIKINESRKTAQARKIPENARKENGFYILSRQGDHYEYQVPIGEKSQKAFVYQGDEVMPAEKETRQEMSVEDYVSLEASPYNTKGKIEDDAIELMGIQSGELTIIPTDLARIGKIKTTTKLDPKIESHIKNTDAINEAGHKNLSNSGWETLEKNTKEYFEVAAKGLGIKNKIEDCTAGEAIKFVKYAITEAFGSYVSEDSSVQERDKLDTNEFFHYARNAGQFKEKYGEEFGVVCRHSSQVFVESLKAIKNIQEKSHEDGGNLKGLGVKMISANLFKKDGGTPGVELDHAWVEIYVQEDQKVHVLHLDPNFGIQKNDGGASFVQEGRFSMTLREIEGNKKVAKALEGNIKKYIGKNNSKGFSREAQKMLGNTINSLLFTKPGLKESPEYIGLRSSISKIYLSVEDEKIKETLFAFAALSDTLKNEESEGDFEIFGANYNAHLINAGIYNLRKINTMGLDKIAEKEKSLQKTLGVNREEIERRLKSIFLKIGKSIEKGLEVENLEDIKNMSKIEFKNLINTVKSKMEAKGVTPTHRNFVLAMLSQMRSGLFLNATEKRVERIIS